MLGKVDTLKKIKDAESKVRSERASAEEQALRMIRDARATADALLAKSREEAEANYAAGLDAARVDIAKERAALVKKGKVAASAIEARTKGADFDGAVKHLVEKFKAKASGKAA